MLTSLYTPSIMSIICDMLSVVHNHCCVNVQTKLLHVCVPNISLSAIVNCIMQHGITLQ